MHDEQEENRPSKLLVAVLVVAFVAALAGLIWSYSLAGRLTHAEAQLAATQKQNQQLASALNQTNAKLQVTSKTLGHQLGVAQREMQRRARTLLHHQQAIAAQQTQQPGQPEQQTQQQPGASVPAPAATNGAANSGAGMSNGKTNLAQAEPQSAGGEVPVRKAQGGLGAPGELIATNQSELKVLEQMGGRDYFPFTLRKGKKEAVATIVLLLHRVNVKHTTYSITVYSGGKKIEEKNRALDEPVQFYAGKQHLLFELVVNQISHDQVQGYLSTPKAAQKAPAAGQN